MKKLALGFMVAIGAWTSVLSVSAAGTDNLPWVYTPETHPADVTVADSGALAGPFSSTWSCIREATLNVFRSTYSGILLMFR